jgi:hypothetical protein
MGPPQIDPEISRTMRQANIKRLAKEADRLARGLHWPLPLPSPGGIDNLRMQRVCMREVRDLLGGGLAGDGPEHRGKLILALRLVELWLERTDQAKSKR